MEKQKRRFRLKPADPPILNEIYEINEKTVSITAEAGWLS